MTKLIFLFFLALGFNTQAATPEHLVVGQCSGCKLPFTDPGLIAYDDEKTCAKDRLYLLPTFKKMPDWIKAVREDFPEAKIQRECTVLVMKSFFSSAQSARSQVFATCANSTGAPKRGAKIACITQDYANSVYNALVDVSDCLNMDQKDTVAKLFNESGLHINTYAMGGDTGIGQLTGDAIGAALEPYWKEGGRITVRDYYLAEVGKSTKASCQRIINYPAAFQKISTSTANRCSLINAPENPYRNLLYTALFYRTLVHNMAGIRYVAGKDYVETENGLKEVVPGEDFEPGGLIARFKMKKHLQMLGIKNPDMHALTRALVILGYNAGPSKAATYFDVYLRKRLQSKRPLKQADVDFLLTGFLAQWKKVVGGTSKSDELASPALLAARKTSHLKPIPEYLYLMQDSGAPGYLSRVAERHKELVKLTGDNRCVSENYIRF